MSWITKQVVLRKVAFISHASTTCYQPRGSRLLKIINGRGTELTCGKLAHGVQQLKLPALLHLMHAARELLGRSLNEELQAKTVHIPVPYGEIRKNFYSSGINNRLDDSASL
jgi:hypothetical protein